MIYQMSKNMFDAYAKNRKGKDKNKSPYKYVMEIVNAEYGIIGKVEKISVK